MILYKTLFLSAILITSAFEAGAQKKNTSSSGNSDKMDASLISGLTWRNIGPAKTSGRIGDIAVNPGNIHEYYVAAASGGVWKTENAGTTYFPVFENEGSYSIGCITLDPSNPHTVWIGTGENNNQRSVGYGDGIYKSEDGGKSWNHMGLKNSEHIGKIIVDPRNSDVVFVAAYGPLWSSGGDRGIYKSTDGGKSWKNILNISEHTGFNEVHFEPGNPDVLYAAAHQRRRHEWTYISGGPESAIYKSTDGGNSWKKLTNGLPTVDMGRIGLAVSDVNPDFVYAIIEAADKKGGVYRSTDRGASWEKRGSYTTSGNYYQELYCDPVNPEKIYSMDVWLQVSNDGGKSFSNLGEKNKHVDNHALWVNPKNTSHMLAGCDGGLYETWDGAKNWNYKPNLPIIQFYKVEVDNSAPFYNVYGGTQDNFSLGGPARTNSATGIVNEDWFVTNGGDGFESQIDPGNPNIVYAQSQYGGLVRFDKITGETIEIRPVEMENDQAMRWNWDAPLVVSKHVPSRLYFASNKVFRSDDRGNSWKAISGDLSRQIDRNKLPVMGKVWSVDAVAKNASTSIYGNVVAISESPLDEKVLYAGTDDGLIHVSSDGGNSWIKTDKFPGVPERSYVNVIWASQFDKNIVYAGFNNHRSGDFKPYILKSTDQGKTWKPIQNNLPERGSVYAFAEDHVNRDLVFCGTEFGFFFSSDGGSKWTQLKGGLPTIAVRDIAIQKRENDIVIATFGRGFYVMDDYSPLRNLNSETISKPAHLFAVKDGQMFIESRPLGHIGKSFQGASYYHAPNPETGAVFTYYLKDDIKTMKEKRREAEKEKMKNGGVVEYPSFEQMKAEDREEEPYLIFTVTDEQKNVVRRLTAPAKKGIKRMVWDFRHAPTGPVSFEPIDPDNPYWEADKGYLVVPGKYFVSLSKYENGVVTELVAAQSFNVNILNQGSLPVEDRKAVLSYNQKVSDLRRAVAGAESYNGQILNRVKFLKAAVLNTPQSDLSVITRLKNIEERAREINVLIHGDATLAKREFETLPGLYGRIEGIVWNICNTTCAPTQTFHDSYEVAAKQFKPMLTELKSLTDELSAIENTMEQKGAPYTPGRFPDWKEQ